MTRGGFVFDIEVRREGVLVGAQTASLAPCREDTLYREILSGRVPNDGTTPDFVISPLWEADPPTVTAFEVAVAGAPARRYGREILESQARAVIQDLTGSRALEAGQRVDWSVVAREQEETPTRFGGRVMREPVPFESAHLPEVPEGAFEVGIDAALLSAFREQFVETGPTERAWLLTGRVLHDVERAAVRVCVRGAVDVAAGRGGASRTHFAFDPRAFVAARRIARDAEAGNVPVGWSHTHPPCEGCRDNPGCQVDTRFFSASDVEVQTCAFASPFMVGLVVGKRADRSATEPGFRLYGWSDASVREISYRVDAHGVDVQDPNQHEQENGRWT